MSEGTGFSEVIFRSSLVHCLMAGKEEKNMATLFPVGASQITQWVPSGCVTVWCTLPQDRGLQLSLDGNLWKPRNPPGDQVSVGGLLASATVPTPMGLLVCLQSSPPGSLLFPRPHGSADQWLLPGSCLVDWRRDLPFTRLFVAS